MDDARPARLDEETIRARVRDTAARARTAAAVLREADGAVKGAALRHAAAHLRARRDAVLAANARDLEAARRAGRPAAFIDRLALDETRVDGIAAAIEAVAGLPDPVGAEIARWQAPSGLDIARVRVPLGVIGIIYESRPNVTADAAALALMAGNAAILKPGSESMASARAIHECLIAGLEKAGLPAASVGLIDIPDRRAVGALLRLADLVDVIVPRGGRSLIERVMADSRIPVLAHLEGLCHTYVHASADPAKARRIVLNAKMRRTGICGATETLLIDEAVAATLLPAIADDLIAAGCALRGCARARAVDGRIAPASEEDWRTEYLDAILSIRVVSGLEEALDHIARFSSGHTEAIVAQDEAAIDAFLRRVDSAIVMANASTQFADGGEFGMGAEIGIATGRLHARGPVGVEQLTTFKYVVRADGLTRP